MTTSKERHKLYQRAGVGEESEAVAGAASWFLGGNAVAMLLSVVPLSGKSKRFVYLIKKIKKSRCEHDISNG